MPGVITALAGLITAIVGLLQVPFDSTPPDDHTPSPQPVIVITPDPVPVENPAPEQLDVTEATTVSNVDVGSDVEQLIDACASGDPDACADVLDLATQGCYEGYAATCDFLYEVTEVGSDLEAYGATCGGRVDSWSYAGRCTELPAGDPSPDQLDVTEATTVSNVDVGSDVEQLIDACASGDPDACADVLDLATQGCYEGYAATCDFLYEVTEVGSDLEAYGATCGGRVDSWDYAGRCAGL